MKIDSMTLNRMRTVVFLFVLVGAAVVLPVTHDMHETADHDCTLCQLRHSGTGDVVQVQTTVEGVETAQRVQENPVNAFNSQYYLPSGSRAPPA